MKKCISYTLMMIVSILFTACSVDDIEQPSISSKPLTVTFCLPDYSGNTRSVDENGVDNMIVAFFDKDDVSLSSDEITKSQLTPDGANGYKVTLQVPTGAEYVKVVANANNPVNPADIWILKDDPNTRENMVFSGKADLKSLEATTPKIQLVRVCAKTEVAVSAPDLQVTDLKLFNAPLSGATEQSASENAPNIPENIDYASSPTSFSGSIFHYEAEQGKCFIIVEALFNGVKGYYKMCYIPTDDEGNSSGHEVAILRNHRYIFDISAVNDYGYSSLEEAVKAPAENRLKVLLKDYNESIYNLIACADFYLGVAQDFNVKANATTADFKAVTSLRLADEGNNPLSVEIPADAQNWIKEASLSDPRTLDGSNQQSEAKEYTITLTLTQNNLSTLHREAEIVVRSGDLARKVKVTQQGWDFLRDDTRKVLICRLDGDPSPTPYFDFIDNQLQGETEDEMFVNRSDCLHFDVAARAENQYYYLIPKRDGDVAQNLTMDRAMNFEVVEEGNYWRVNCLNHAIYDMWSGKFEINNTIDNTTMTVEVVKYGVFHHITPDMQEMMVPDPDGNTPSGWYYYENVKVTGTDGKEYNILDRNIGASCNKSYSPEGITNSGNIGSRGAYFKISPGKNGQAPDLSYINRIAPAGYRVPDVYHLQNMGAKVLSASYGVAAIPVTTGAMSYIFLPYAGQMEGAMHANSTHVNLWSANPLAGNQGFSATSPEYGYWYQAFDLYGTTLSFRNVRIGVSDSEGNITSYTALPVRCMSGPDPTPGWSLPEVSQGRKRLLVINAPGWREVNFGNKKMMLTDGVWWYETSDTNGSVNISGVDAAGSYYNTTVPLTAQTTIYDVNNLITMPDLPAGKKRLILTNVGTQYSNIRVYYWNESGSIGGVSWDNRPAMQRHPSGRYYYDMPETARYYIVTYQYNNGGVTQTADKTLSATSLTTTVDITTL